ncbi:hypothetical protein F383_31119 [Gossypium arboreum]|uniref:Uncharacterized protein n=1 Tax=Gossypium arboreum TaxID=29729 RepID=A0A0B0MZQ7_GOSAR|nr:hypothetical protein F383_31119 [Gossypium arboreum]
MFYSSTKLARIWESSETSSYYRLSILVLLKLCIYGIWHV